MDNSLSAPAIRQMFLDFFTEKVGHGHGRVVVVGVGWALGSLHGIEMAFAVRGWNTCVMGLLVKLHCTLKIVGSSDPPEVSKCSNWTLHISHCRMMTFTLCLFSSTFLFKLF